MFIYDILIGMILDARLLNDFKDAIGVEVVVVVMVVFVVVVDG